MVWCLTRWTYSIGISLTKTVFPSKFPLYRNFRNMEQSAETIPKSMWDHWSNTQKLEESDLSLKLTPQRILKLGEEVQVYQKLSLTAIQNTKDNSTLLWIKLTRWSRKLCNTSTQRSLTVTFILEATKLQWLVGITARKSKIEWRISTSQITRAYKCTTANNRKKSGGKSPPQRKSSTGPIRKSIYLLKTMMWFNGGESAKMWIDWKVLIPINLGRKN